MPDFETRHPKLTLYGGCLLARSGSAASGTTVLGSASSLGLEHAQTTEPQLPATDRQTSDCQNNSTVASQTARQHLFLEKIVPPQCTGNFIGVAQIHLINFRLEPTPSIIITVTELPELVSHHIDCMLR